MTSFSQSITFQAAMDRAIKYLLTKQDESGFWGYHPGKEPSTEATAWCAMSLGKNHREQAYRAVNYLLSTQNKDGGWSTALNTGASDWSSGPATLALRIISEKSMPGEINSDTKNSQKRSFDFLFEDRTDPNPPVARFLLMLAKGTSALNYGRGWPWTPNCWNWVEPSSYNLLALKIPHTPKPEVFKILVDHVHRYFIDHACEQGGWNHGSNHCLGHSLPPFAVTTAEALLSLQDIADHPTIAHALTFLASQANEHKSAMSSAWSILARLAYGQTASAEAAILLSKQNIDGSFGPNLMVTGLSVLALRAITGDHALLISP